MPQHVPPLRNQLVPKNSQSLEPWKANVLECAFLLHHVADHSSGRLKPTVTKQIDHIVEVARSRSFAKGADFFSKKLLEGVTTRHYTFGRRIRIHVSHGPHHRRQ